MENGIKQKAQNLVLLYNMEVGEQALKQPQK
ncbi:uncharacterized protein G2W53_034697 [Senna tora]|uniref:Uncharacterized protein n=1 Tax=Senna tora TaxID=362788 RepID=A0A834T3T5_9FABA|nr:uncharacterized protein G2W53_034697 [Senna tora]